MNVFLTRDRIIGIGAMALGAVVCFLAMQLPQSPVDGDVGSGLFPMIGAVLLLVCGLALVLKRPEGEQKPFLLPFQWKRLLILYFTYVVFAVCLWKFGFVLSSPVVVFWLTYLLGRVAGKKPNYLKNAAFSIALPAVIYLVYQVILSIPLPKGTLF